MNGTPGNPIANDGFLWTMMDVPVRKVLATEGKCHGKFPWNHETNPWNQQCIISIAPICIIMYQYITNMYHLSSVYIYMVYMVYMVYIYIYMYHQPIFISDYHPCITNGRISENKCGLAEPFALVVPSIKGIQPDLSERLASFFLWLTTHLLMLIYVIWYVICGNYVK